MEEVVSVGWALVFVFAGGRVFWGSGVMNRRYRIPPGMGRKIEEERRRNL